MTVTMTHSVVSKIPPRSYLTSGAEAPGAQAYLYVHLRVTNTLMNVPQILRAGMLYLDVDGSSVPSVAVQGQSANLMVQPGTTVVYVAAFPLGGDVDAAKAALVVAEPGRIAARLPLSGALADMRYPIPVEADSGTRQVTSGSPCATTMLVEPLDAVIDLDAGLDLRGIEGDVQDGRRARTGQRFLRIQLRATGDSSKCGGANVKDEVFRLRVDGDYAPAINHISRALRSGESVEFTLLFRVPAGASSLALQAGAPGGIVAEYAIKVADFGP
jgi:hypothetical protein